MDWLLPYFEKNPELAVFLAIGVGYWIGKFKVKGVGFGPVTGSLLAGLLIGSFVHVPVSDTAKSLLFLLFMYGIGYSAGPSISRSWGNDRSRSARHRRQASKDGMRGTRAQDANVAGVKPPERDARVATSQGEGNNPAPSPKPLAPSATTPPVQTLE